MFLSNCFSLFIGILCLKIVQCIICTPAEEKELTRRCFSRYPKIIRDFFEDHLVTKGHFYTIFTDKVDSIMFISHHENSDLENCDVLRTSRNYAFRCKQQADSWVSYKSYEMQCFEGISLHFAEVLSKYCNYSISKQSRTYIIEYHIN